MTIHFGAPVSLDDITIAQVLEYPIWVWAWEAGREDEAEDEACQCPVIGTDNVTPGFTEPVITVRVKGTQTYGSGSYNLERDQLEAISLWQDEAWIILQEAALPAPIVLVAIPKINGVAGVEFVCHEPSEDRATRVGG